MNVQYFLKNIYVLHYCIIAIVFLAVNYCILQYSIAFLATIAIAIAIVLSTIANALDSTMSNGMLGQLKGSVGNYGPTSHKHTF